MMVWRSGVLLMAAVALAGCSVDMGGFAFTEPGGHTASVHIGTSVPVLGPDGRCTADASLDPSALKARPRIVTPGMSECDLVRIKGQPSDVLIGTTDGQREVQVVYRTDAAKTVYVFRDNRLIGAARPTIKDNQRHDGRRS